MSASPSPAISELHRPRPLALADAFRCEALHAILPARVCLLRQAVSARQRTRDSWRGQAPEYPTCTERCAQGRELRATVAGAAEVTWSGTGPSGRVVGRGARPDRPTQDAARRRLELVGLLDIPPCLDEPPDEDSEQDRGVTRGA